MVPHAGTDQMAASFTVFVCSTLSD